MAVIKILIGLRLAFKKPIVVIKDRIFIVSKKFTSSVSSKWPSNYLKIEIDARVRKKLRRDFDLYVRKYIL